MDELKRLAGCGQGWAEQRAQMALSICDSHARGDISRDECCELLEDLVRTDSLDKVAGNIETKTALIKAVNVALMLV
jgi:hypothetical protein